MEEVEADVLGTLRVAAERTIVQRNVIRRNAKLPQLDVDHELAREVAVLTRRAQREAASIFADDLRRIHHDTLTEYQTTHGPQFGKSIPPACPWFLSLSAAPSCPPPLGCIFQK